MRRLFAFALILALLLATAAMGEETFLDDTGAPVSLEAPTRVAALSGSLAQIWLLAGGEVACVTQDALEERDLGLGEDVVNAGSLKTPSAELILAAGVDFALLTPTLSGHIALGETLRAAGVRTAFFDVETFEDYLRCLDFCTRLTGQPQRYEQYGTAVQASVDEAIARSAGQEQAPRVLLLRAYSTGVKAKNSDNNMVGAMLRDLGCENIADGQDTLLENLTLEAIVAADPDFIFITTMGADDEALASLAEHLQSGPAWAGLTAVKEGRCFVLPKDLFHYKPCERWSESYHQLAEMLYGAE